MRAGVDRFLGKNMNYERVGQAESVLVVRKCGATTGPEVTPWDLVRARLLNPWFKLRR